MSKPKLFLPGPTEVSEPMRMAMTKPMIGHRGGDYSELHSQVVSRLRKFIGTKHEILVFTSSATGVMEAAIRNGVSGPILHTICGAFGERWSEISQACNKEVKEISVPYGQAIKPDMVKEELDKQKYAAVAITHNETSSGVINPLKELCAAIKQTQTDALIFVDAVSSFGGTVINPDELEIDVLIFGTQKCMALPPGIAFAIISPQALKRSESMTDKGYYFDFIAMGKSAKKDQTPSTPAISLLFAVAEQLERMCQEGMANRAKRHDEMFKLVQDWFANHSEFSFLAEENFRSPTVTAVSVAEGFDVTGFRNEVKSRGYLIADGYGPMKGKGLRIGHMGDWQVSDVKELLSAMEESLNLN